MPTPSPSRRLRRRTVAAAAAALAVIGGLSWGSARAEPLPSGACAAPRELLTSPETLPQVAKRLAVGAPLKVVALGSSSTAGTGASSAAATYPSRFGQELQRLFPESRISVLNKGVAGEDAREELLRFQRDVLDEHPDLLIWQTGTNSALQHNKVPAYADNLIRGLDEAQAAGIDVLLISPQYSPKFEAVPNHRDYLKHLSTVAALQHVPLLPRYEIMKFWVSSGEMTAKQMVNPDGLHQTDASYYCLGMVAAHMVAGLADRPAFLAGVTAVAHTTAK